MYWSASSSLHVNDVHKIAQEHPNLKLSDLSVDFDKKNKIPSWNGTKHDKNTNVQTIFKLLGAKKVSIVDISEYENPDFLVNLNNPINKN